MQLDGVLPPVPPVFVKLDFVWPGPAMVGFDQPLVPGLHAPGNWFLRDGGTDWPILSATVAPGPPTDVVQLAVGIGLADPRPDKLLFTPPPFDIRSAASGLPVAGFEHPAPA